MKRTIFSFLLLTGIFLTGCIETHLLVTVKNDGSGTVRETIKMKKDLGAMMQAMAMSMKEGLEASGMEVEESETSQDETSQDTPSPEAPPLDDNAAVPSILDMFNEEDIKQGGSRMGSGVRYVSHEMIDNDMQAGYVAVYAFDNINTVYVDQNPTAAIPDMPGGEGEAEDDKELVAFRFVPGNPAQLTIRPPRDDDEDEDADEQADTEEAPETEGEGGEGMEQMKEVFRDMRMTVQIAIDGDIQKTNASFVDGSTITMVDVNFNVLLDDPELLKQLEKMGDVDPAVAMEMMKKIPGLRVETAEEVSVTFK
jgi:hypothetical protein